MPWFGSLRSGLLIALSTVLLGFTATASAGSGATASGSSTTATLGRPFLLLRRNKKS